MAATEKKVLNDISTDQTKHPKKKRYVFFGLNDTLIDFSASVRELHWTGGSVIRWQKFCKAMHILDRIHDRETHFGICSSIKLKDGFSDGTMTTPIKFCDSRIALSVIGEKNLEAAKIEGTKIVVLHRIKEVKKGWLSKADDAKGLSEYLNSNMLLFTDGKAKEIALENFYTLISEQSKTDGVALKKKAIWIVTNKASECNSAYSKGFTAIHANNLFVHATEKDLKGIKETKSKMVDELINRMLTKANKGEKVSCVEVLAFTPIDIQKRTLASRQNRGLLELDHFDTLGSKEIEMQNLGSDYIKPLLLSSGSNSEAQKSPESVKVTKSAIKTS